MGSHAHVVIEQVADVFAARAQRRQFDADHVEAVEQVLAELAALHAVLEILVRGRDDAHVDLDRRLATDAVELALGEHAQQSRLQRRRHVADFVEEQRAAIGLFEAAAPQLVRACERALLVAEQLGFEQLGRDRRCVECDEWLGGARTVFVQCARHQFLARTRLARDQHRHARA
jgi:hypothetical protein